MHALVPGLALSLLLLMGCSAPEVEHREPKIIMAPAPKETNAVRKPLTLAEARRTPARTAVAFDTRSSPFGSYDAKMIETIEKRWLELTPRIQMRGRGEVVVEFKLNYDGGVTDVQVQPTRLLGIAVEICKQAILESAPFDPWPAEMRKLVGKPEREITFRFNYR